MAIKNPPPEISGGFWEILVCLSLPDQSPAAERAQNDSCTRSPHGVAFRVCLFYYALFGEVDHPEVCVCVNRRAVNAELSVLGRFINRQTTGSLGADCGDAIGGTMHVYSLLLISSFLAGSLDAVEPARDSALSLEIEKSSSVRIVATSLPAGNRLSVCGKVQAAWGHSRWQSGKMRISILDRNGKLIGQTEVRIFRKRLPSRTRFRNSGACYRFPPFELPPGTEGLRLSFVPLTVPSS
jgi:hypothetical protein